ELPDFGQRRDRPLCYLANPAVGYLQGIQAVREAVPVEERQDAAFARAALENFPESTSAAHVEDVQGLVFRPHFVPGDGFGAVLLIVDGLKGRTHADRFHLISHSLADGGVQVPLWRVGAP